MARSRTWRPCCTWLWLWGRCTLCPWRSAPRGVNVQEPAPPGGAVRRRGLGLALASVAGLAALLGLGLEAFARRASVTGARTAMWPRRALSWPSRSPWPWWPNPQTGEQGTAAKEAGPACEELGNAVTAWNQRLGALAQPVRVRAGTQEPGHRGRCCGEATMRTRLQLDATRLQETVAGFHAMQCSTLARTLGQMLGHRFATPGWAPAVAGGQRHQSAQQHPGAVECV